MFTSLNDVSQFSRTPGCNRHTLPQLKMVRTESGRRGSVYSSAVISAPLPELHCTLRQEQTPEVLATPVSGTSPGKTGSLQWLLCPTVGWHHQLRNYHWWHFKWA